MIVMLLTVVLMTVAYLINGLAAKLLWGWFIAPAFSLPMLSIAQAIGLGIIVSFLTHQHIPRQDGKEKLEALFHLFISPVVAIVVGWVVYQFI